MVSKCEKICMMKTTGATMLIEMFVMLIPLNGVEFVVSKDRSVRNAPLRGNGGC
jgi:hypothetical protein